MQDEDEIQEVQPTSTSKEVKGKGLAQDHKRGKTIGTMRTTYHQECYAK